MESAVQKLAAVDLLFGSLVNYKKRIKRAKHGANILHWREYVTYSNIWKLITGVTVWFSDFRREGDEQIFMIVLATLQA